MIWGAFWALFVTLAFTVAACWKIMRRVDELTHDLAIFVEEILILQGHKMRSRVGTLDDLQTMEMRRHQVSGGDGE